MTNGCSSSGCAGCGSSGHCGNCGGGELILCKEEVQVLLELSQFAFLPIVQKTLQGGPKYFPIPGDGQSMPEGFSELIASLERKGLITVDPNIPIQNVAYGHGEEDVDCACGSLALTAQGQEILDWISPSDTLN